MTTGHDQAADGDAEAARVKDEALDWLRRIGSGELTRSDLEALDRWRLASREHRRAFAEANLFWDVLGKAAREADLRGHAGRAARAVGGGRIGRRALLSGAAAATLAYVAVRPPLGLWPSVAEFTADYRTATGEQRQVALGSGVVIDMNTQTSLTAPTAAGENYALELVSGEVAVTVRAEPGRALRLAAARGRIEAEQAGFNVRRDGASVCVTCSAGLVRVTGPRAVTPLAAGQQLSYGDGGQGSAVNVDTAVVTAWKRGMLIFRDAPLTQVIAELNRYRPGKIILLNQGLADRNVFAGFRLDRIGEAVGYLCQAVGAKARSLPGGVVLLS
jgi:transmembrane sensor